MSDIFQEVDDALQQEKLERIWKEYGSTIITAIIVVILTTAGWSGFRAWDKWQDEKQTSQIISALEQEKPIDALQEIIKDGRSGHQAIAVFGSAAGYMQNENLEQAQAVYQNALDKKILKGQFEDIARIMVVRLALSKKEPETDATPLLKTLTPLLKDKKNPWSAHAKTEAAFLEANLNGDYAAAIEYLDGVAAYENVLPDVKARAAALRHVYQIKADEKAASQTGTDTSTETSN